MRRKFDATKLIALAGMALSGIAMVIGNWAQERQMEQTIEEKVNEALAKRDEEEEESY